MEFHKYEQLLQTISAVRGGDVNAREKLVEQYKPFILKTASHFCGRMLEWGRDDELSIGLIAFNSALDSFEPDRNVPFLPFCRVVILNRLRDFARRENRFQDVCHLDDEILLHHLEGKAAWDSYLQRTIEDERREEIEEFQKALAEYAISFEDLVEVSPRHRDYRRDLLRVARSLAETAELMEHLTNRKQLPLSELEKISGVKRKTLERGRKFIIASALVLSQPERFIYLRSYINFEP